MTRTREWAEKTLIHKAWKRPLNRKKVANNTYLERRDNDDIAVKFHQTDVVTYRPDGTIVLQTGGWFTNITSDRISEYAADFAIHKWGGRWNIVRKNPDYVSHWHEIRLHEGVVIFGSDKHLWHIEGTDENLVFDDYDEALEIRRKMFGVQPDNPYWLTVGPYFDGVVLDPDNPESFDVPAEVEELEAQDQVRMAQIEKYLKGYTSGEHDRMQVCPECRDRGVKDPSSEHLLWHVEEGIYSEDLLRTAIAGTGYNPSYWTSMFEARMHKRWLRRYLRAYLLVGNRSGRRPDPAIAGVGYEWYGHGRGGGF